MKRVPLASRALVALLIAGSAAVGAPGPASADGVLPPDPPAVLVVGAAAVLDDGRTVLLDGHLNGSGVINLIQPPGNGEAPAFWSMGLTPQPDAADPFATEAPGWALPIGDVLGMSVPIAWAAGAAPVSIDLRAVGASGAVSAPTTVVLKPDDSSASVSAVEASIKAETISLTWKEASVAPVTAREVVTETAPATADACGDWGAPSAVALPEPLPATASPDSLQTASPAPSAPAPTAIISASSNLPSPTAGEPLAAEAPFLATVNRSRIGLVAAGAPAAGTCYRFTVRVHDALGRSGEATGAVLRVPVAAPPIDKAGTGEWTGSVDIYRRGTYVSQATPTWCVAASAQMMINLVKRKSDTTATTQKAIMRYAQANDGETTGVARSLRGTDAKGWTRALSHFGAGRYRTVRTRTLADAMRAAAIAIRTTGRPVGLFAMGGRHAWVMTGFSATADPLGKKSWKVTSVRVSGPLWPYVDKAGYDPAPDTLLSVRGVGRFFTPAFGGKEWQLVVPVK